MRYPRLPRLLGMIVASRMLSQAGCDGHTRPSRFFWILADSMESFATWRNLRVKKAPPGGQRLAVSVWSGSALGSAPSALPLTSLYISASSWPDAKTAQGNLSATGLSTA